jgi:hypothetical protein
MPIVVHSDPALDELLFTQNRNRPHFHMVQSRKIYLPVGRQKVVFERVKRYLFAQAMLINRAGRPKVFEINPGPERDFCIECLLRLWRFKPFLFKSISRQAANPGIANIWITLHTQKTVHRHE